MPSPWGIFGAVGPPGPPGPPGTGSLTFATVALLAAQSVVGLPANTTAIVDTPDDLYTYITPASAALIAGADGLNVVSANGDANGVWTRRYRPSEKYGFQTAWVVDDATGDDTDTGLPGAPLKTLAELAIRLRNLIVSVDVTVTMGSGVYLGADFELFISSGKTFLIQGVVNVLSSDIVLSHTVAVPATNTSAAFATIGGLFTRLDRLYVTAGVSVGACTTVIYPTTPGISAYTQKWLNTSGAATDVTNGDTVSRVSYGTRVGGSTVNNRGAGVFKVAECEVTGGWTVLRNPDTSNLTFVMFRCDNVSTGLALEGAGTCISCRTLAGSSWTGSWTTRGNFASATCNVALGNAMLLTSPCFDGSSVGAVQMLSCQAEGSVYFGTSDAQFVGINVNGAIDVRQGGICYTATATFFGGAGNVGVIFSVITGGQVIYTNTGLLPVTTAASFAKIGGVNRAIGALPNGDANRGCYMGNRQ